MFLIEKKFKLATLYQFSPSLGVLLGFFLVCTTYFPIHIIKTSLYISNLKC